MKKVICLFSLSILLLLYIYGDSHKPCFELFLIDSQGRCVGYDVINQEIKEEIPESSYVDEVIPDIETGNSSTIKSLEVLTPPKDKYILYIIGITTGHYVVNIRGKNRNSEETVFTTSGTISAGEIKRVLIDYTPEVSGVTQIFEDNTSPITTLKLNQPNFTVFDTIYITPATIIGFESTDPQVEEGASGVKYTEYCIDNTSWIVYTTTFTIIQEGNHIIEYRSIDNIGNIEETKSQKVFITTIPYYTVVGLDKIRLTGKIEVEGNIRSNNKTYLTGCVSVDGNVYSKEIYISKKSTVTGSIIENATEINSYPIDLSSIIEKVSKDNNNDKIPLTEKGKKPIDKEGRLVIHNKDKLTLPSGIYYFNGIEVTGRSELKTEGTVSIFCCGDIKILGNINVNSGNNVNNFVIFVSTHIVSKETTKQSNKNDVGDEESFVIEDIFDKEEIKELKDNELIENKTELTIDHRGRIYCKKDKEIKIPRVYIGGKVWFNGIIYAPKSNVMILGFNNYTGNIFADEINILGKVIIKNPNLIINNITSPQQIRTIDNNTKNVTEFNINQPDATFKLGNDSYPNPAKQQNPKLHIEVGIADNIRIQIYNIAGELVHKTELEGNSWQIKNGRYCYEYEWNIKNIASGVYIYVITAEKQNEKPIKVIKKLAVVK